MLSVIIPTMWKFKPFPRYLEQIIGQDCIGEVILIDNDTEARPKDFFSNPKIKLLEQEENIYVNPAWNLGAKIAQYSNLCFLSDDVIADGRIYFEADSFLNTHKDAELLVTLIGHEPHGQPKVSCGEIKISYHQEMMNVGLHGAFSLFFMTKESYKPIPEKLKVIHGDAYLHNKTVESGGRIYCIHDFFYYSPWNTTISKVCKDEKASLISDDLMAWDEMVLNKEVII